MLSSLVKLRVWLDSRSRKGVAQSQRDSMREFEALGASSLLKLLAADLWSLFWSILFICFMWSNSCLLSLKMPCLVLDVKSRHSRQHASSQLETTAQFSTHTTYKYKYKYKYKSTCVKMKLCSKHLV